MLLRVSLLRLHYKFKDAAGNHFTKMEPLSALMMRYFSTKRCALISTYVLQKWLATRDNTRAARPIISAAKSYPRPAWCRTEKTCPPADRRIKGCTKKRANDVLPKYKTGFKLRTL